MSHPAIHRALASFILLLALLVGASGSAQAHPANVAGARAKVALDGSFSVKARFDILAYVLNLTPLKVPDAPMNALLDGPPADLKKALLEAQTRFAREMAATSDAGTGTIDAVTMPTVAQVQDWVENGLPPRLPVLLPVTIKGHLPPGAKTVSLGFPPVLGTLVLTVEIPNQEPFSEPLDAGAFSTPLTLAAPVATPTPAPQTESPAALYQPKTAPPKVTPKPAVKSKPAVKAKPTPKPKTKAAVIIGSVAVKDSTKPPASTSGVAPAVPTPRATAPAHVAAKSAVKAPAKIAPANSGTAGVASDKIERSPTNSLEAAPIVPIERAQTARPSWFSLFGRFVLMGFHHIVPAGVDHMLFVLGLFLLGSQLPALVKQITAFTVAHSITLALSLYGVVRLPPSIVEPLIALSIVFVAVENLATKEVRPWRILVIFAFGLVHGLGFAGALQDLGLARSNFLTALFGFNIGVELGQLSVVAAALLAVGWFRGREGYRRFVVVPASLAIAAVAAFWTLQRVFFAV